MFTLYTTPLSANGRKTLALSHQLGLAPRVMLVNVYKGEGQVADYLAVNPQGKVPSLVDGDLVLWESNAILQYLSEAHAGYALWSDEPKRRADLSRWLFWEASHWQPAMTAVMRPVVASKLASAAPAPDVHANWNDPAFKAAARLLDVQLSDRAFLGGDALTLVDFSVAGMMTYARTCAFPFGKYPNIERWYQRIEALPAWQTTAVDIWRG